MRASASSNSQGPSPLSFGIRERSPRRADIGIHRGLGSVALSGPRMCHNRAVLQLVSRNVERPVEDTDDVDVSIVSDEVSNSKMSVEQDSNVSRRGEIPMSNLRESRENLCPLVNSVNGTLGSARIVGGDVLEDIFKPALGFVGPGYFCHERMRCPICSLEIVRLASESASPRSTMT